MKKYLLFGLVWALMAANGLVAQTPTQLSSHGSDITDSYDPYSKLQELLQDPAYTFIKKSGAQDGLNHSMDANCTAFIQEFLLSDTTLALIANMVNGVPPYSYAWSMGEISKTVEVPLFSEDTFCVTITDGDGCEAEACFEGFVQPDCFVAIYQFNSNNGFFLQSNASGDRPFQYAWSTGGTLPFTTVTEAGTYCLTITDAKGCMAEECIVIDEDWGGECNFQVTLDYFSDGSGVVLDINNPNEVQFDQFTLNDRPVNLPLIIFHQGTYSFKARRTLNSCQVEKIVEIDLGRDCDGIPGIEVQSELGYNVLTAQLENGSSNLSYFWTDFFSEEQTIVANNSTTYCVEIKDNEIGCYYRTCIPNFILGSRLYGSVSDPESGSSLAGMLYTYELRPEGAVLRDSVETSSVSIFETFISSEYNHKVRVQPYPVGDRTFAPSYYYNALLWEEADTIKNIGVTLNGIQVVAIEIHNTEGPGVISGSLIDSDGFVDLELGVQSRGTQQNLGDHDILLFHHGENAVVGHMKTTEDGRFHFENLALGNYRVILSHPAAPSESIEVSLTADNPHNGVADILLSDGEIDLSAGVNIYPNPAESSFFLENRNATTSIRRVKIFSAMGVCLHDVATPLLPESTMEVNIEKLPAGTYIIQMESDDGMASKRIVKR